MTLNQAVSRSGGWLVAGIGSRTAAHGPSRDETIAQSGRQAVPSSINSHTNDVATARFPARGSLRSQLTVRNPALRLNLDPVCRCAFSGQRDAFWVGKGSVAQVADWQLCGQCGRKYWAGDSYSPVPPPPRLPHESLIRYFLRATFTSIRRTGVWLTPASRWDSWSSRSSVAVCEECSAKNDQGWKAHERFRSRRRGWSRSRRRSKD
jgi:hypothetical protein